MWPKYGNNVMQCRHGVDMSAKILRQKYMRDFSGMEKYKRLSSWAILAGYFSQIAAAAGIGMLLLGLENLWVVAPGMFLVLIFIGTRMRGLNNIIHECSHATFVDVRKDNTVIGSICSAFLFGCFQDYRDEHLTHHKHVGDYDQDLDLQGIEAMRLHDPLTIGVVLRHVFGPFIGRHLPYYLSFDLGARDGHIYQIAKFGLLALAAVALYFAPWSTFWFVLVPYLFVFPTLKYWADCLDHAGLVPTEDDLYASRNILAPGLVRWLFFPRNDCYHLVHHLFPQIPARHLGKSHSVLLDEAVYCTQPNAVRIEKDAYKDSSAIAAE